MPKILVTGATGFLGSRLTARLAERHEVLALSRAQKSGGPGIPVCGAFTSFEDLRALDRHTIDAAVHLAAVTGGCSEEDGLAVNVDGTRRLLRYLYDRGCRRVALASSIAATGCLDGAAFRPQRIPIPDDHPCLAFDAYGLSKFLMEEVAAYFARIHPDLTIMALRIGGVFDETKAAPPPPATLTVPILELGLVASDDVVRACEAAVETPLAPGFYRWNVVGPDATTDRPVAEALRFSSGVLKDLDLSWYERDGHAFDPVFSMEAIARELGFRPQRLTRPKLRGERVK